MPKNRDGSEESVVKPMDRQTQVRANNTTASPFSTDYHILKDWYMGAWRTYSRWHRYHWRLPGADSVRRRIQHLRAPMSARQTRTEASLDCSSFSRYDTIKKQRRLLQYTCRLYNCISTFRRLCVKIHLRLKTFGTCVMQKRLRFSTPKIAVVFRLRLERVLFRGRFSEERYRRKQL